ncbi:MAG: aldehyde dehydrogenase family protein, partial [Kangiella sp.]|nr:aldehyde dehydrogenase family protein [Kangiella sp.]
MSAFKLLINGEMVDGDQTMEVINPATEQPVATCARASEAQLNAAVAAAKAAFPGWAATPIDERKKAVNAIADAIEAHGEELARLLVQEQGKPLGDAMGEVFGTAAFFRYFTTLDLPVKVLDDSEGRRVEAHRKPLGVVGAIVPWNFPMILMAFKLSPALIAGNTVVLKPAPTTPLTSLRLGELVKDILPAGVLHVISDANDLGAPVTARPDVRSISSQGSTATGA